MGCGVAQGYHVSRPLESSAVVPWILETQRNLRKTAPSIDVKIDHGA